MQKSVAPKRITIAAIILLACFVLTPWFDWLYHQIIPHLSNQSTDYFLQQTQLARTLTLVHLLLLLTTYLCFEQILKHQLTVIKGVILIQITVIAVYAFSATQGYDGFEHIHYAWNISIGQKPFTDFFEHHHPLLAYLHAPLFSLFNDPVAVIWFVRIECFVILLAFLWAMWKIGELIGLNSLEVCIAVSIFLSLGLVIRPIFVFRPDQWQIFFNLLSILFLLRFIQTRTYKQLVYSGVCWAIGFLFLQKALFVLAPVGIVLLVLVVSKDIEIKAVLLFSASIVLTLLVFFGLYFVTHSYKDYLMFNWLVNLLKHRTFASWTVLVSQNALIFNGIGTVSIICGIVLFLVKWKNKPLSAKILLTFAVLSLALMLVTPRPYFHYYIFCFVVLSLFSTELIHLKWPPQLKRLALSLAFPLLLFPLILNNFMPGYGRTFQEQLNLVRLVDQHSSAEDYVWDPDVTANVFRKNIHFFWFHFYVPTGLNNYNHYETIINSGAYNELITNRKNDFDFCSLMEEKKPKLFVVREDAYYDLDYCEGLMSKYEALSQNPLVYIRIE